MGACVFTQVLTWVHTHRCTQVLTQMHTQENTGVHTSEHTGAHTHTSPKRLGPGMAFVGGCGGAEWGGHSPGPGKARPGSLEKEPPGPAGISLTLPSSF